jgi:O-antigen/teichoic acid export membrane protein
MPGRFPKFVISDFLKNVVTLISGTTLAQIISLAIYLVITRIYDPDDLGVFALFMSIIAITVILASAKYELAIMLPARDEDSINLVALSGLLSIGISLVLLLAILFFHGPLARLLGNEEIEFWLYLVPLATFLNGIYQSLNYWSNRNRRYRNITAANLGQSLANSAVKVVLGVLVRGPVGLISGTLTGQAAGFAVFGSSFLRHDRDRLKHVSLGGIREMARTYSLFPKYNMLHGLVNNLSGSLPIFIFTSYFGSAEAGLYSLGITVIFRPLNLVASALKQVLSQQIITKQNDGQHIMTDLRKLLVRLFQIGLVPFLVVGILAPVIFRLIFGAEWEEAGRYTQLIMAWLFMVLLSAPFSFIPDLFSRQRGALLIEVVKLAARIAALASGVYLENIYIAVLLYGIVSFLATSWQLAWYFSLAKRADAVKLRNPKDNE